ncbi:glycoside hydrolase family 3 C-terminal domain-containing protein [Kineosporia sp. J2-2]|uniref:Glycoside hydrolase family 3 C-terminal domain-containing protein n=1 Tax=Kineosporia corallincola TaxID=2835133 RepID=A0ABS5TLK7_9ACTN|nr:glycoside hydrolase family 3 N-terminal domain-containing protein [Kineosporia corallincola]MBT0770938.1 glycoside hydrolase family 3 C-terminal domain-containing protein [Kineosporia corallincola]
MENNARWRDPSLPVTDRVEDLLARMTVEEKAGQLAGRWVGNTPRIKDDEEPATGSPESAPMEQVFARAAGVPLEQAAEHGLGHLTRVYGSAPVSPAEGAAELARQQGVVTASRLGIPAIAHEECLTGVTTYGATVYPAAIAWAATFDPELIGEMAAAIGRDLAELGVHQGLSPLMDVVRDYRWGRVEETLGEDPYLVAELGSAYVRGLQDAGIIATLKHFAGYSASRSGRNHGPVPMGRRELLDVILPPFEAAVAAGAGSVMHSYSDVDGVPAGADSWLLTEILRDDWGFTGTLVSDYWATPFLALKHRIAPDYAGAAVATLEAGLDVELPDAVCFSSLPQLVHEGRVDEGLLDRAVRRVLTQKAGLGLLDPGWSPRVSPPADLDPPANRDIARRIARSSVVLLDPGTALPLVGRADPAGRIAVVGPCADDPHTFMGCYAFPNHVLPKFPEHQGLGIAVPTALDALREELPGSTITHEQGCRVMGDDRSGIPAAVAAAREADLCIAFVGDRAGMFGLGSSGEGCDVDDLELPGAQAELLDALLGSGTPVVVVVVSGRPYALGDVAGRAAGLVQAFMPGEEGGEALAGVLSGRLEPGGRLPVQIPRSPGGQPFTYLQPPLGEPSTISSVDVTPLFPFGHGRSYTEFELTGFGLDQAEIPTDGEVVASVVVHNRGRRAGTEVVQLYLGDPVAQVVRPVRWLAGFARVRLEPGGSARVAFRVHADRTALVSRDLSRVVEPGEIEVSLGTSSRDLPARGSVRLTGESRVVGHDRVLRTPVDVTPVAGQVG